MLIRNLLMLISILILSFNAFSEEPILEKSEKATDAKISGKTKAKNKKINRTTKIKNKAKTKATVTAVKPEKSVKPEVPCDSKEDLLKKLEEKKKVEEEKGKGFSLQGGNTGCKI